MVLAATEPAYMVPLEAEGKSSSWMPLRVAPVAVDTAALMEEAGKFTEVPLPVTL